MRPTSKEVMKLYYFGGIFVTTSSPTINFGCGTSKNSRKISLVLISSAIVGFESDSGVTRVWWVEQMPRWGPLEWGRKKGPYDLGLYSA